MPISCIPRKIAEKLKQAIREGKVDISKFYEMSSAERRAFFQKYTTEELGRMINVEFEKGMISKQKTALTKWAESVFTSKEKTKQIYKSVLDRINHLDELGVLTPKNEKAFLSDLVADRLGVSVTPKEVEKISGLAKEIQRTQTKLGDNLGDPTFFQENIDFFKSKKAMDNYLLEINPAHKLRIATGTIGRGMMLASLKSPILNIESNTVFAVGEALTRRVANRQLRGGNNRLALSYWKMTQKIYQDTGYDISRMLTITDVGASGERVLGPDVIHSRGKGIIRKAGQVTEDIVFKQLMGAPDVVFSAAHFADSVNLQARTMAKGNRAKATELMKDAMRVVPRTAEGELLRAQGILDAQYATYTNTSWATKLSLGVRKVLNDISGDLRIGDFVMPFVKTPANVVAAGIDYAGASEIKAVLKIVQGIRTGEIKTKAVQTAIIRDVITGGLGLTTAYIIASLIGPNNFVGEYDPRRNQIEKLRNTTSNMVKIGGKWISIDYFGPLGIPVAAILFAKKYGTDLPDKMFQYGKGIYSQISKLPGIDILSDVVSNVTSAKVTGLKENVIKTLDSFINQAKARLIPSILSDISKATDVYERETGKSALSKLRAGIPFVRKSLPIKYDIFGEPIKTENFVSVLVAGSRIKTAHEGKLIEELNRLYDTDNAVTLVDLATTTRKKVAELKGSVSETEFNQIKIDYGQKLKTELDTLVNSVKYSMADDDEREKLIRDKMEKVINQFVK